MNKRYFICTKPYIFAVNARICLNEVVEASIGPIEGYTYISVEMLGTTIQLNFGQIEWLIKDNYLKQISEEKATSVRRASVMK